MIRVSRNLGLKERLTYTFDNFRGVDFSTSPFKVAKNRATKAQNLIFKDGVVRKRTGWKMLWKFEEKINGLFNFELNDESITLAYVGTTFYRLYQDAETKEYVSEEIALPEGVLELKNDRIQVFINNNKAYIIGCGDYLVYGKFGEDYELRRVYADEETYVPTTTINIDHDGVNDTVRAVLDSVNILTPYRKNELLGVDEPSATWTLDGVIDENSKVEILLKTIDESEEFITLHISNRLGDKSKLYFDEDDLTEVGTIDFENGKITLNINTKPQSEDDANIIVKFASTVDNDFIFNAKIGVIYGTNGNSDRLFISGSKTNKNMLRWSEPYDYTYFPDTNYDVLGSDASAIVGFVRVTDGTLLVFKEDKHVDATLYYITGSDVSRTDYNGDIYLVGEFYKKAGSISDTMLTPYASASLNGDNLILTKNGVRGLALQENITIENYRLQDRSRTINGKLLKEFDLDSAAAIAFDDKYILSVNGVTYVADGKFTYVSEEDIGLSFNYEWHYWTNVDARVWCVINGELYFGGHSGKICKFSNKDYADISYQKLESGELAIDFVKNRVIYFSELAETLKSGDTINFAHVDIYACYIDNNEDSKFTDINEEYRITFDESLINKIYDGVEVYADKVNDSGLMVNTKYTIGDTNYGDLTFRLYGEDDEVVPLTSLNFRLNKKIDNKNLYIVDIDNNDFSFKLKEYSRADDLELIQYNNTIPAVISATITFKENIKAEWYTPIIDLGTNMFSKTLLNFTVSTEPLVKNSILVGYQTRNISSEFTAKGVRVFSFDDLDFEDFSFEADFGSSFTKNIKERNFNFIMLRYVSDNQNACAVNSMTIRYKINRLNKGVR